MVTEEAAIWKCMTIEESLKGDKPPTKTMTDGKLKPDSLWRNAILEHNGVLTVMYEETTEHTLKDVCLLSSANCMWHYSDCMYLSDITGACKTLSSSNTTNMLNSCSHVVWTTSVNHTPQTGTWRASKPTISFSLWSHIQYQCITMVMTQVRMHLTSVECALSRHSIHDMIHSAAITGWHTDCYNVWQTYSYNNTFYCMYGSRREGQDTCTHTDTLQGRGRALTYTQTPPCGVCTHKHTPHKGGIGHLYTHTFHVGGGRILVHTQTHTLHLYIRMYSKHGAPESHKLLTIPLMHTANSCTNTGNLRLRSENCLPLLCNTINNSLYLLLDHELIEKGCNDAV